MMYGTYNDGWGYGMMSPFGWFGGLSNFIFWILIICLIVWGVRRAGGRHHWRGSNALEILKERYAKGEINKEEFETKKKDLLS